jgi:hypothetical protein
MERAKAENLWFFCHYQQLWFSPAELEEAWADGRFRWGTCNWTLRQPSERLTEMEREAEEAERARQRFVQRMGKQVTK